MCHSGVSPATLPRPFEKRQGVDLEDVDGFEKLLSGIARHNEISKLPRLDLSAFAQELNWVLTSSSSILPQRLHEHLQQSNEYEVERNKILAVLEKSERALPDSIIESISGVSRSLTKILLSRLDKENLIWTGLMMNGPNTYGITDQGREHLLKQGLLK